MSDERPPYVAEARLRLWVDDTRFLVVDVGHPSLDMEHFAAEHFGIERSSWD